MLKMKWVHLWLCYMLNKPLKKKAPGELITSDCLAITLKAGLKDFASPIAKGISVVLNLFCKHESNSTLLDFNLCGSPRKFKKNVTLVWASVSSNE